MIGFSMLGSNDVSRARAFYDALMPLFGASLRTDWSTSDRIWYMASPDTPMIAIGKSFDGRPATIGNGNMIALVVPSQEMVATIHAKAVALGGLGSGLIVQARR